jgi:hypothetical protein
MMSGRMDKNFWRDLYPTSETHKRFARSTLLRIYLPIGAAILFFAGIAVAVLASSPGDGLSQSAQLATTVMAAVLLAAGFLSWLLILVFLWGLYDVLEVLPVITSRVRPRFVIAARSWRKRINGVRRISAAVFRFLSPARNEAAGRPETRWKTFRREGRRDD